VLWDHLLDCPWHDFQYDIRTGENLTWCAEEEGHHPDLHLAWGRVDVRISTHDTGGLTENDFILAAKVDRAFFRR
jgi:4a-hydroxytetrahydrobiopterin dehydratase